MLLDNLKIHVAGLQEVGSQGKIRLTLAILEAVPAPAAHTPGTKAPLAPPAPVKASPYPGFKKVGAQSFNIDAATAAGVQRGHEFTLTVQ